MAEKKCPKCGKSFDESWQLCDVCGLELIIPSAVGVKSTPLFATRIRDRLRSLDTALDSKISKAVDTAEEAKKGISGMTKQASIVGKEISEKAEKQAQVIERKGLSFTRKMVTTSSVNAMIDMIIAYPKLMLIIVLLFSLVIGASGIPLMLNNITGDMTIYLPQDDEASIILNEVNEDWSTEIIVLFVETPNKFNRAYGTNITDKAVLDELSRIEEAMDPQKDDKGFEDEISFILSISTLIKEINLAPKNIAEAVSDELGIPQGPIGVEGEYAIPEEQDDIDRIVMQIPEDMKRLLVKDTNNDQIWDSAGIMMGVKSDDQAALMKELYKVHIDKYFVDPNAPEGDYNSEDEWEKRVTSGEVHCRITPTGPVPITDALTERTYQEFAVVLPAALALICGMLFFFHRTLKILIISGIPILCSLMITLGIVGLTVPVLSPQVILLAPIILALGVAYGLYIANRYSDERKNIPDKKERMRVAVRTTGRAIFLSAITTAVGFSSLMMVNMVPMQVLGFGLTVGILVCFVVTMVTVPSLVMFLNYEKKGKVRSIEKIASVPIRMRKTLVIAAVLITVFSIALIPAIEANMNLVEMAPQDEPTITKMNEYTENFGGGQLGMVVVRGAPAPSAKDEETIGGGSMKDIEVLRDIEDLEDQLKTITDPPISPPISVVDVMKMIKVPESILNQIKIYLPDIAEDEVDEALNTSFWDAIENAGQLDSLLWHRFYGKSVQDSLINIFYNSISEEMRGFLVNDDYSKALIYIDMPSMDAVKTENAVNQVNEKVAQYPAGKSTSKLTGFAALVVAINNLLMFNSIVSLALALIIVFFVLIFMLGGSLRYAAMTMIPVSMVVAWEPLTLWATGIDLNLITAMIGSIIVGIGIDYGIHMTERVRESGENLAGIQRAVGTSGFTFLEATATIVAGLLSIFLINIRSIQEFIVMIIILLVFSMLGAMFLLPSIYAIMSKDKRKIQPHDSSMVEVEPEYGYE